VVGEGERAVRAALEEEVAADPEHEEIHVAVAGNVDRIGADDVLEQLGIGADIEWLLLEFKRPAGARTIDVKPSRILATRQEHRGKTGPVTVERRPAAADEEFPRTVVDAVNPCRLSLLVHQGHIADRLLPVIGARRRDAGKEDKN
jgi:hypothetical protein